MKKEWAIFLIYLFRVKCAVPDFDVDVAITVVVSLKEIC